MQEKHSLEAFYNNLNESSKLFGDIMQTYTSRLPMPMNREFDPFNVSNTFFDFFQNLAKEPEKLAVSNLDLYIKFSNLWIESAKDFLDKTPATVEAKKSDRRFKDEAWNNSPGFKFVKDSYLTYAEWLNDLVKNTGDLDKKARDKLEFYVNQYIDAISPSNFLMTNPEVIRATLDTNAENLVKGLKKLAVDIKRGTIQQTDLEAFQIGKNLAMTPGKVVFRNELMELIQYEAQTAKVHKTPLLFIPAWINKFYIVDLSPGNSFAKWLVEQGHTLFIISWVNPTAEHADKDFEHYMFEGVFAALEAIEKLTGEKKVNAIGYCLGGTLLATSMAYMAAKKISRVKSATFLTTLLDFSDAGKLSVFIDEEQVKSMEKRMNKVGYLEGNEMGTTFAMLRANDLIWSFVVNNYLLGKDPFPFDILYWNADSTRMPAKMHSFYLRNMYLQNNLIKPNGIKIRGVGIDLRKIKIPTYFLSTLKDHIAPWKSTFEGAQIFPDARFVLADSGHVAGVVSPPDKTKYPHWESDHLMRDPDKWLKKTRQVEGSWWLNWGKWIKDFAGAQVPARKIKKYIEAAPGSYVKGM